MLKLTLKQKILKQRGIVGFQPQTRAPITIQESTSTIDKTPLMQLLEYRFNDTIENLLSTDNHHELEKKLGVDYTTISRWRKLIRQSTQPQISLPGT
jgi:hypothetical protein